MIGIADLNGVTVMILARRRGSGDQFQTSYLGVGEAM
jgi:hypothetical protein